MESKIKDFESLILEIPSQIQSGIEASKNIKIAKKPDQIVFCGMGGSAIAADILKLVFAEFNIKIPIVAHKDYDLPLTLTKNSLIICASYSGNTEESISAYKKAISLKKKPIVIASGGRLKDMANKNKSLFIDIAIKDIPPRLSVVFMLSALVGMMVGNKILPPSSILKLKAAKGVSIGNAKKLALGIVSKLENKTPIIYSSLRLSSLAYIIKISFNENAKIHSFCSVLPECQHNEIQGFADESLSHKFYAIFIKDHNDHPRIKQRVDIMADMIGKRNFGLSIVELNFKNIFEKIIFAIFLGSFLSLGIAKTKNQDPVSVPLIEELKSALKK